MRADSSKRLTILSQAEKEALYGVPDFDDFQREEFFAFTAKEYAVADRRKGAVERLHCLIQIGYFKAKQDFFDFSDSCVPTEDIAFLLSRYFPEHSMTVPLFRAELQPREQYAQRKDITELFGYQLWSGADRASLAEAARQLSKRDVTPTFVLIELLAFLKNRKIVRPGVTTLQLIISQALATERRRLEELISMNLNAETHFALQHLLIRETTLSELAALKQDARNFGYQMMTAERRKRAILAPLHHVAKNLLPQLGISQQNIEYYASLVHYYTIYDLRRMKPEQSYLYLLCYAWLRYRQLTDNLADAFTHHLRQIEEKTKETSKTAHVLAQAKRQQESPKLGRVLLLYVDETFDNAVPFGSVRERAFTILPRQALLTAGKRLCEKPVNKMELRWHAIDREASRFKKNLRPLAMALNFSAQPATDNPWVTALLWMRDLFSHQQSLIQRPIANIPENTIPKTLQRHLLQFDKTGNPVALHGDRYEFWIYRQIGKRFTTGELALDDSIRHRRFSDDLIALKPKNEVLETLSIPWLKQPADVGLIMLCDTLHEQWQLFDKELRQGTLKHLDFDKKSKSLRLRKPKKPYENNVFQSDLYNKLPARGIADIFHFVNEQCGFLSAMTPLQPRYAKKIADDDSLMAVILARAMGHGNLRMAETCDIPYHVLEETDRQYIRLAVLRDSCTKISNFIAGLSVFPLYSIDPDILYGSVDGQKFASAEPTIKARYSRKYFGRGKGVVAYTLLANHVALETELIGANEHESHYVFDICYHNSTDIMPTAITGDMHSINKANYAIMHCFGMQLSPHYTNLQAQIPHLYCSDNIGQYQSFLLAPAGEIDIQLIISEKDSIDRIIATLAMKEMSQSILVRKLCALSSQDRTRRAIFELDKLVRSIYTLKYIRNPQLQRYIHRSQNRLEAYHQLRSAISQVAGKRQLIGGTDLDVAITNQCGRLIANVVIAYNSVLLSTLLERHMNTDTQKAKRALQNISPVAWQHIQFLGRYLFRGNHNHIDPLEILRAIKLT